MQGMMVLDEAALPVCDASNENLMVYVQTTKSFQSCTNSIWAKIDFQGQQGAQGEKGEIGGDAKIFTQGITLNNKYKNSIFKLRLVCELDGAVMTTDSNGDPVACSTLNTQAKKVFSGSGFLCGKNRVCSNMHVVTCLDRCYPTLDTLSIQAIEENSSSVNSDSSTDTGSAPFFSTNDSAKIKAHASADLAKVTLDKDFLGEVLPIASEPFAKTSKLLSSTLSMSFPLGFQDLYVDVGQVISEDITHCTANDAQYDKYSCPANFYDFATSNDTDHGSSGAPIIDISSGQVIGLTSAGTEGENANYTWAIDSNRLNQIE